MLSILANTLRRATFTDRWNAPDHWTDRRAMTQRDHDRQEADIARRQHLEHRLW